MTDKMLQACDLIKVCRVLRSFFFTMSCVVFYSESPHPFHLGSIQKIVFLSTHVDN